MAKKKQTLSIEDLKEGLKSKANKKIDSLVLEQEDVVIKPLAAKAKGIYKVSSKKIGRHFIVAYKHKTRPDFSVYH